MSVMDRSCGSSTDFNFSGWEESEGGDRRRVRFDEERFVDDFGKALKKSDSKSRVTDGAMIERNGRRI